MKQFTIEWRHLDENGDTCLRCSVAGKTLHQVIAELKKELKTKNVKIIFKETKLSKNQITQSNMILINDISLEQILSGVNVSQNYCSSCSCLTGIDAYCRTVEYNGKSYDEIPEIIIRRAVLKVAGLDTGGKKTMNRNRLCGIILSLFFVASFTLLSGCTTNSENVSSGPAWLKNYTPVHSVSTGSDDFWTVYPKINPESGSVVSHLDWVLDSLDTGCVLFVVHATGCVGCQAQADRVIRFGDKYEGQLVFWDLDFALGGDIEQKSYKAYVYDPDGYPGYIALTGIITLVKEKGEVTYGWHSWEGNVGDSDMETWIQDAIYYYQRNS